MSDAAPTFLAVRDVHKRFSRVHAVAGISLTVARGEIFALLGPNGAGKSTLLRMIVGITRPDEGVIRWNDQSTGSGALAPAQLGYLPEERGLYQDMPVGRVLAYFGRLRGMSPEAADGAVREWLDRLSLAERAGDKVSTLSKGNQQKVQFAAAVLHQPAFAILDEPFSGLDPLNQELFLDLVRTLRDTGTTVLLSAHQMALVERLADRVFVMQHGREVLQGTLPEIRERWGTGDRLVLQTRGEVAIGIREVAAHSAAEQVSCDAEGAVTITLARGHHVGDLLALCARSFDIISVRTEQASLHDVYVTQVSGTVTPEAA